MRLLTQAVGCLLPSSTASALPPLPAIRFLVEAAATPEPPTRRGWPERLVWTMELFAALERRERSRSMP